MPGGQLSWERGGGGGGRGSQRGIKRKGYVEKVSGGAGSPPHPPAWLDVAQGMLSAGLKLQEAEPFPSSHAWGGLHWVAAGVEQQPCSPGPGVSCTP